MNFKALVTSAMVAAVYMSVISLNFETTFREPDAREANHRGAGWPLIAGTDCAPAAGPMCPANGPIPPDAPPVNGQCNRPLICHDPSKIMIKKMCIPSNWLYFNNPCDITWNSVPQCVGYTDGSIFLNGLPICSYAPGINALCGSDDTCSG
jgi:hypothetical protein